MRVRKEGEYFFDSSHLEKLGLFVKGDSDNTTINAISPDGDIVKVKVTPLRIKAGTMFVPKPGQDEALRQLFPRRPWNI